MTVLAITVEVGSLGDEVICAVADRLHLNIAHLDAGDQPWRGIARILRRKSWNTTIALRGALPAAILELAARGNVVIEGWSAVPVLRPIAHVICVHICAPLPCRLRVLMQHRGIDEHAARRELRSRRHAYFKAGWMLALSDPKAHLYDLVLNTERTTVFQCVDQILTLAQGPAFQETAASRAHLLERWRSAQQCRSEPGNRAKATADDAFVIVNGTAVALASTATHEEAVALIEGNWHSRDETVPQTVPSRFCAF